MAGRIIPIGRADAALPAQPPPPLSVYVHIPWCVRKCPYCDFNSHRTPDGGVPETRYINALLRDLEQSLPDVWGRPVSSVFIGGGTPSLFSPDAIDRLLSGLRALLPLAGDAEITLEANPGTVDAGRFQGFRDAGITRLSLGIQSFDNRALRAIGRMHDGNQAHRAAELARPLFEHLNLDLMAALPGQDDAALLRDLDTALALAPDHLSVYQLTLEPHTPFAANPPPGLPDDDTAADLLDHVLDRLGEAGFDHYETSAHARPGHRCRHNLNYWTFGDYLGLGAGAHGKLSLPDHIIRDMRWKQPTRYLSSVEEGKSTQESVPVEAACLPAEFMMNALRLNGGFDPRLFPAHTRLPLTTITRPLQQAVDSGLIEWQATHIRPTALGQRHLNRLISLFLDTTP